MNKFAAVFTLITLSTTLFTPTISAHETIDGWQRINAPQHATVKLNGVDREIHPGCAFAGDDYSFYFKKGKSDKLAILFNGGGACWNSTTCLASLNSPAPSYVPSDEFANSNPLLQDGMLNLSNPDNPYKDWNIAFLPYCTGDIHFGSKDTLYPTGPSSGQTIRHRGFDNFLYAREWLKSRLEDKHASKKRHHEKKRRHGAKSNEKADKEQGIEQVLVVGSSAGAYGAILNYPYIKDAFPDAQGYVLADGGSGVFVDSMLQAAIRGPNSSWNFDANLSPSVPGLSSVTSLGANGFTPAVYSLITNHYPDDRFAQYTTVHDVIQTLFHNVMTNSSDITQWNNLTPATFATWTTGMLTNSYTQAASPNYRFFIAPGCQHTILRSPTMYSSQTVGGTTFLEWMKGLSSDKNKYGWDNLSCTDTGCQFQPLSPAQINACLTAP